MLQAEELAAFRGERLVFAGRRVRGAGGRGAGADRARTASGKSTLLRVLAGLGRPAAGRLLWDGADALADRTAHAARLRYLGHQDAVKPGLTVAENLRFWGGDGAVAAGAGGGRPGRRSPICRPACSRPGRSGGWRSPGWRWRRRRSGCWTSRRWGWTTRRWRASARCWPRTAPAAAWWWRRRTCRCRCRMRRAAELAWRRALPQGPPHDHLPRPARARTAAVAAPRQRHAGRAAVLRPRRRAVPAGHRPGAGDAGPHGAGHRLGVRAAGGAAAARPAVRRRFRGRLARPAAALRPAAVRGGGGQGAGRTGWSPGCRCCWRPARWR